MSMVAAGTGKAVYDCDCENQRIQIDLSGDGADGCYRNDASIYFFAANSYYQAYKLIEDKIQFLFENKGSYKIIGHYVLSYMFNFRQFLELEIKGLLTAISEEYPKKTHVLSELCESLKEQLEQLKEKETAPMFRRKNFAEDKKEILSLFTCIEANINDYYKYEPYVEYYRYIFGNQPQQMKKEHFIVALDFRKTKKQFSKIAKDLCDLCMKLNYANYYVQFSW